MGDMTLKRRSAGERRAYYDGWQAAVRALLSRGLDAPQDTVEQVARHVAGIGQLAADMDAAMDDAEPDAARLA